jgi:predicted  nucleic acid-binding Zn-ribbon protein
MLQYECQMFEEPQYGITRHESLQDLRSSLTFWKNGEQALADEMASYSLENTDLRAEANRALERIQEEIEALERRIDALELGPSKRHHWLELQCLERGNTRG